MTFLNEFSDLLDSGGRSGFSPIFLPSYLYEPIVFDILIYGTYIVMFRLVYYAYVFWRLFVVGCAPFPAF